LTGLEKTKPPPGEGLAASDDSPEKTNPMTGGPFTYEDENGRAPCVQVQAQAGQLSVFSFQFSVISFQLSVIGFWPAWGHRYEISPRCNLNDSKELPLGC
jgi:hypothetical protein